ncbi:MAG: ornithine cyclodeaminase family protein [Deltaproteobacteria bacterium]|nr:ornithine cyclodeaminase family protein [Deltaproteobacteria bacterium]
MALYISNSDVDGVLTMKGCMDSIEGIYQELAIGDAVYRHRIDVFIPPGKEDSYFRWGTMEGGSRNTAFAIRLKSDMVYWPQWEGGRTEEKYCVRPGLFCGFILLFGVQNGEPLAMINDGVLQHMRVGACAGLGVKYLARQDAGVVGMIGSGGMARTYLMAFCEVRKISKVKVYSPTRANREKYAREMEKTLSLEIEPVDSPEKAVRGSDIVATCTDAITPVIKSEWIEPGMHLTDVNGSDIPDDVIEKANVVVRLGEQTLYATIDKNKNRHSAHIDYMTHGIFSYVAGQPAEIKRIPKTKPRKIYQDDSNSTFLVDLISGKRKGRQSHQDVTFFDNRGTQGLQFAAVGKHVYDLAKARGIGKEFPTEWFLQDIRD